MTNTKVKILHQIIYTSYDPEVSYMVLMIIQDDEIIQTVSVRLYNNFSHFESIGSHYALNAFGNN
jgi:hypothetical protein